MSGENQSDGVQQQIADVIQKSSELETSLAEAEQDGDGPKVSFLRTQLEQLYKARVALQKEKNILLKLQPGGQ